MRSTEKRGMLKLLEIDSDNFRVYYKATTINAIYCIMPDGDGYHLYRCSTDGEPSHRVFPKRVLINVPIGDSKLETDVRKHIFDDQDQYKIVSELEMQQLQK